MSPHSFRVPQNVDQSKEDINITLSNHHPNLVEKTPNIINTKKFKQFMDTKPYKISCSV